MKQPVKTLKILIALSVLFFAAHLSATDLKFLAFDAQDCSTEIDESKLMLALTGQFVAQLKTFNDEGPTNGFKDRVSQYDFSPNTIGCVRKILEKEDEIGLDFEPLDKGLALHFMEHLKKGLEIHNDKGEGFRILLNWTWGVSSYGARGETMGLGLPTDFL